jgi:hypothetical protein
MDYHPMIYQTVESFVHPKSEPAHGVRYLPRTSAKNDLQSQTRSIARTAGPVSPIIIISRRSSRTRRQPQEVRKTNKKWLRKLMAT